MLDLASPPGRLLDGARRPANFGMFEGPIPDVDLEDARLDRRPGPIARLRLKQWQHVCVVHPKAALTWAAVDAAYMKLGWARFIDRSRGRSFEHARKGVDLGVRVARSLWDDRTAVDTRGLRVSMHNHLKAGLHRVALDAGDGDERIRANLDLLADATPLVVHLPLERGRSMYSHKVVLPVKGHFEAGGVRYDCVPDQTYAILDIHKAHYPRRTFWNWATLVARDDTGVLGLNLTRNVVPDPRYHENALWTDGALSLLGAAKFDFRNEACWQVGTEDGHVDLTFRAQGERREDLRLVVIESVFRQRFGTFSGRIGDREINDAFGLVEDHRSVW